VASYRQCKEFTSKLEEVYKKLKENNEDFEIVLISLEDDEDAFQLMKSELWLQAGEENKQISSSNLVFMLSILFRLA